jgi:hypothetical protein
MQYLVPILLAHPVLLLSFFYTQSQSNVAIKVNAKLSNSLNEAHSWKIADSPWTSEVPTLIMGFYMSSGKTHFCIPI